jgi:hypothetical protein
MALSLKIENVAIPFRDSHDLTRLLSVMEIDQGSPGAFAESIPFSAGDTTAGSETELQAAVAGEKGNVDLPVTIEESNYYRNIIRRAAAGETPGKMVTGLEKFLVGNRENVWENSWARFPRALLTPYVNEMLDRDLLADKSNPESSQRGDVEKIIFYEEGREFIRIPVSYLLKLSLADVISVDPNLHPIIKTTGERIMRHFINDNTSPETYSFHPVLLRPSSTGMGSGIAHETLKRFLITQLLIMYANKRFRLLSRGQEAVIYFSPHPPMRQKRLNDLISDSFYRELFMSPCLSGWDRGEEKYHYMILCHQVLSRSQLNTVAKLKEAGIITRDLVVLPNISNISLANNGTHVSLGSRKLTALLRDASSGFTAGDEKHLGDLVIKITEHFLPLFVGAYSAAPYRIGFHDFHPEKVLGFLPHEIDYTHLRMIWRRWRKKAGIKIFGQPVTPFGPKWLDTLVSGLLQLKGDFVPDFRLTDYLVALMSTEESPALDGRPGNEKRLKKDLADLGIFDRRMSLYLLCKLREFSVMGFSGFEGRYYSVFENITKDMGRAVELQTLITALAFKCILKGKITHADLPDDPSVESERRQIFFGSAIGIPTFFIRKETRNRFMAKVLERTEKIRPSHRYPGYLRVYNLEYRKALLKIIREDAADLIELMCLGDTLNDLENRISEPDKYSASGRLTRGILDVAGVSAPMKLPADEFNLAAERYYRTVLRKRHIEEGLRLLEDNLRVIDLCAVRKGDFYKDAVASVTDGKGLLEFLSAAKDDLIKEDAGADVLRKIIYFILLTIHGDIQQTEAPGEKDICYEINTASVR